MRRHLGPLVSLGFAFALSITAVGEAQAVSAGPGLMNGQTLKCLDASVSQGVRLAACNGSVYQQWDYNGTFRHAQSGKCLDASLSQGIRLVTCDNANDYQRWGWGGDARMVHAQTGKCLDGSLSQGVRLTTCNNTEYQKWY